MSVDDCRDVMPRYARRAMKDALVLSSLVLMSNAWAYSEVRLDCLIQRTEERVKALEETDFTDGTGAYCSVGASNT